MNGLENFDFDEENWSKLLTSAAISLKRIADSLTEIEQVSQAMLSAIHSIESNSNALPNRMNEITSAIYGVAGEIRHLDSKIPKS